MWPLGGSRSSASKKWISVVFTPGRVDIASVQRRTDEKPSVSDWESIAVDDGELAVLKRLRRRLSGPCTTLLRHGQYQFLQVEAPQVPPAERAQAVRWRVKEMVDFPIERAGVDVLDIPSGQGGSRAPQAFAVVASHAALVPCIHLFQDARIDLRVIDIPELAQRNVSALFEEPNRGLALLTFDDSGGRLTFTYQGELYASRRIDVTRKELAAPNGDALGGVFERVQLDVQRSLDNFDRNYSAISLTRVLVSPIPGATAFIDYLKAGLYQPVEQLDLAQVLDLSAVPQLADASAQADALMVIGAALRNEGEAA